MENKQKSILPINTIELVIIQPNKNQTEHIHTHQPIITPENGKNSRAAALSANDGMACTLSLIIGLCALTADPAKVTLILNGLTGLIIGACGVAIGELLSLSDEVAETGGQQEQEQDNVLIDHRHEAAATSALAFSAGGMIPLMMVLYMNNGDYGFGVGVVVGVVSLVLAMVGWLGPFMGRVPALRAAFRVLLCGWVVMVVSFSLFMSEE